MGAEWLVSHPVDVGPASWSPGDAWPEEPPTEVELRQRRRQAARRSEPPLVTLGLGLGPFSIPLFPRPHPLRWPDMCASDADDPGSDAVAAAASSAGGAGPGRGAGAAAGPGAPSASAGSTQVAQLQALLAQQEPSALEQLSDCGETVDGAFLESWLKARGGSVEAAAAGIAAHAAWRASFVGPAGAIQEESIQDELAARKAFLQGLDFQGCPVVVVQAARHDMGRRDLSQTKRLIAYVLDTACASCRTAAARPAADPAHSSSLTAPPASSTGSGDPTVLTGRSSGGPGRNPGGQLCCLFDLSGLRPRNLDVKALLAIFELLQNHYPERLNSLYFLNAPLLFAGVWRVVSSFVHPNTRQKIHFIAGARARRLLLERMSPEVLPSQYGGAADLVPIEAAAASLRRRRQQEEAAAAAAAAAQPRHASAGDHSSGSSFRASSARARAAALQRRAGSAAHAARRFVHGKLLRPVASMAAGASSALRHSRQQQHTSPDTAGAGLLSEQQQRSLLAQVVLTHVLLMGLLLRMLQRVLSMRRQPGGSVPHGGAQGSRGPLACTPTLSDPPPLPEPPLLEAEGTVGASRHAGASCAAGQKCPAFAGPAAAAVEPAGPQDEGSA